MRNFISKILAIVLINILLIFLQREVFQFQPFLLLLTIPFQIFGTIYFPFEKIFKK